MKLIISKILIVCVFAISFHGFAPDEHLVPAIDQGAGQQVSLLTPDSPVDKSTSSMQASCDICQVVHQYILTDQSNIRGRSFVTARVFRIVQIPPDRAGEDILHPPTV